MYTLLILVRRIRKNVACDSRDDRCQDAISSSSSDGCQDAISLSSCDGCQDAISSSSSDGCQDAISLSSSDGCQDAIFSDFDDSEIYSCDVLPPSSPHDDPVVNEPVDNGLYNETQLISELLLIVTKANISIEATEAIFALMKNSCASMARDMALGGY